MKKNKNNVPVMQLDFFNEIIKGENVKSRKIKFNPKTGIYFEDRELNESTVFKPGARMVFGIDKKNKVLKIMPSENGTKVAVRGEDDKALSVVHVRRKEIIDVFKGCDNLELEIFEESIIVKSASVVDSEDVKQYVVSKEDIEALADKSVDEDIRKTIARHTKDNPILQEIYNVVKTPLKFISIFSGIGAMDYSFELEGFNSELSVEMDDAAVETFKANSDRPIFHGDVYNYDFDTIGEIPIVIAGSPCQDFSMNNSKKVWDSPKNKLVYKVIDIVKKVKAKVFLLENVPQLITTKAGHYIKAIKEALPDFEFSIGVLNSDDYGSAQTRKRAYIIGSRVGQIDFPEATTPKDKVTVREAFDGISSDLPNALDYSVAKERTIARMSYVKPGNNYLDIPENMRTKGQFSNNFRRLEWDKQSCTIVNVGKTIIMPPEENRVLSIREMARLYGIPDNFVFKGKILDKQQQVANTVVINVVRKIAAKIKEKIENFNERLLCQRFSIDSLAD